MEPKKIFVGLSGGVDSAVSAALLQRMGHDVTGVFIKIWQPEFTECTWREDRLDAMRVAAHLKIPFLEIDLSDEYKDEVVADMIAAYRSGRTPNPDVRCNERIKFGHFLRFALKSGAEMVATGHYARIEERDGNFALLRGSDTQKDQSYFLSRLSQNELSRAQFPVGAIPKENVRSLATEFALPVAAKADSQGLCFVGAVSIPEFLSRYITLVPGAVVDRAGEVIGEHDGAALFTIGQRHGFRTTLASADPLYVIAIDIAANTITVAPHAEYAAVRTISLTDIVWTSGTPENGRVLVQTRYRETPVEGNIEDNSVSFIEPHVCSPGQSAVMYRDDECLGSGIIV